jgi:diguanylate cyclase (GGDEF)-like protein
VEEAPERAYWLRALDFAQRVHLVMCGVNAGYFALTWRTGPHRRLLVAASAVVFLMFLVGVVRGDHRRVNDSATRERMFGAWAVVGSIGVSVTAWLDGGTASPLVWMYPFHVVLTAITHRPPLVRAAGTTAVAGFVAVALADGTLTGRPGETFARALYLVALAAAAEAACRIRWRHHDEQLALRHELHRLATRDGLTGLHNHRAFHEHLAREAADALRSGQPLALALIDLDHFKAVNDTHGHLIGDELLRAVAGAVAAAVRAGDVAARVGGEELAVLLPATGPAEAEAIAERLRRVVAAAGGPVPVTASVGVASAPAGTPPVALLAAADDALYEAKRLGRNRVEARHLSAPAAPGTATAS